MFRVTNHVRKLLTFTQVPLARKVSEFGTRSPMDGRVIEWHLHTSSIISSSTFCEDLSIVSRMWAPNRLAHKRVVSCFRGGGGGAGSRGNCSLGVTSLCDVELSLSRGRGNAVWDVVHPRILGQRVTALINWCTSLLEFISTMLKCVFESRT